METNQERTDAKLHIQHKTMMARMDSQPEKMEAMVNVFKEVLDKMDTTELKANLNKVRRHREASGSP